MPQPQPQPPITPAPASQQFSPAMPPPPSRKPIALIITVVLLSLLLIGAVVFAIWAFLGRQDYKENTQAKIDAAVVVAQQETTEQNNARYAEEAKNPLKDYVGPESYGSIKLSYPKTWSGYVEAPGSGNVPFHAYFHPGVVPESVGGNNQQAIALQVEVRNTAYDKVISSLASNVKNGSVNASPYALPKVADQTGTKFVGKITNTLSGTQYVLPLRDKTLVITTHTDQFSSDMDTHILPNLTFVP